LSVPLPPSSQPSPTAKLIESICDAAGASVLQSTSRHVEYKGTLMAGNDDDNVASND